MSSIAIMEALSTPPAHDENARILRIASVADSECIAICLNPSSEDFHVPSCGKNNALAIECFLA